MRTHTFVDLGMSPLSNAFLTPAQLKRAEKFYPLHAKVREEDFLVFLDQFESPETIFGDYIYFSSYSDTWLQHARRYVETVTSRFSLGSASKVVEIASNDGYLLQYFVERGIPCMGVEPAANVAAVAIAKGIPTQVAFFGVDLAQRLAAEGWQADLLVGNNVLAHVPDLDDFIGGLEIALKPAGVLTMEFPHLYNLIRYNQFDTIYHEHFSYFSLWTVERLFARHNLALFDVEELPTHGGSLRIYAQHMASPHQPISPRLDRLRAKELEAGLNRLESYTRFSERVQAAKRKLLRFLIDAKEAGKRVVGYGAPAKATTLLNYCGIRTDLLEYTVDRSPHKQGLYIPGVLIPIYAPEKIQETRPDYVLILPWNLKDEVMQQMGDIRSWGGRFVVPIPEVQVLP